MALIFLFLIFFVCVKPSSSLASLCEDISGRWHNTLGSEVVIDHLKSGILRGKYYTAVGLSRVQGLGHEIFGTLAYDKPGSSFAFSVTWENGSSTTVWTGQCQVCDGKEILETSWLLRSFVNSCMDKWKSTLIGKVIFERKFQTVSSSSSGIRKTAVGSYSGHKCDLRGVWYNDLGSEIILNQTHNGVITGEYRTAVERKHGAAGPTHSFIYGYGAFANPDSTFSLIVVWKGGKSVTGWVGQCHICENNTAILETTWLLRTKVDDCRDVWMSTLIGVNSFTHHEQKSGPRKSWGKHTPNRDGEDMDIGRSSHLVSNIWFIIPLFLIWIVH